MTGLLFAILAGALMTSPDSAPGWNTLTGERPVIIAHRGASGERPEHTLAAYSLAIEQGADFIEPDLVMTRDGVLIVRHDRYLSTTTDVSAHPEFADRRVEKEGRQDWWAEDFTLEEIKTLRAVQPREGRAKDYDGQFEIPAFEEVLALRAKASEETGRIIGVYPETKHPAALAALGLDPAPELARILKAHDLDGADAPVFVQSFEPESLVRLDAMIEAPLIQLVFPKSEMDPALPFESSVALEQIPAYADGVGPNKFLVIDQAGDDTGFVARAHALGLAVHPWTFRNDDPPPDGLTGEAEIRRALEMGVDGVFTDFPATGAAARAR